jgi:dsDNA-specific endonuclease/ATPase MutS2
MPHFFKGVEAKVGDKVIDVDTKKKGKVIGIDDTHCRCTVDFGTVKVTAPTIWFEKVGTNGR